MNSILSIINLHTIADNDKFLTHFCCSSGQERMDFGGRLVHPFTCLLALPYLFLLNSYKLNNLERLAVS